jgi:hypothetical protein
MSFREGLDGCVLFFLLGDPFFACFAAKKERIEDAAALEGSVRGMVGYWEAVLVWEVSVESVPLSRDGKAEVWGAGLVETTKALVVEVAVGELCS